MTDATTTRKRTAWEAGKRVGADDLRVLTSLQPQSIAIAFHNSGEDTEMQEADVADPVFVSLYTDHEGRITAHYACYLRTDDDPAMDLMPGNVYIHWEDGKLHGGF